MENVLCRSNVDLIESQSIWYTIAIVLQGVSDRGDGEVVATMCGKGLGYLPWPSGHVPRERA